MHILNRLTLHDVASLKKGFYDLAKFLLCCRRAAPETTALDPISITSEVALFCFPGPRGLRPRRSQAGSDWRGKHCSDRVDLVLRGTLFAGCLGLRPAERLAPA